MAARKLFGQSVEPACTYCQHGRPSPDKVMILCNKFGPVAAHYSCKRYVYDPLKRVPKKLPGLPQYSKEDFEL